MKYITLSFLIISITINGLLGMPPDKVETKHAGKYLKFFFNSTVFTAQ